MLANVLSSSKNGGSVENVSRLVNAKKFTGPCRKTELEPCSPMIYDRIVPLGEQYADFKPASLPQNNELELILKGMAPSGASSPPVAATYLGQSPPVRSGAANPLAYSSSWYRDAYSATRSNLQALRELDPTLAGGAAGGLFAPLGASFGAASGANPASYSVAAMADDVGFDFMPSSPEPSRIMNGDYGMASAPPMAYGGLRDYGPFGVSGGASYCDGNYGGGFEASSPPAISYLPPPSPHVASGPAGGGSVPNGTFASSNSVGGGVSWPAPMAVPTAAGEFRNIPVRSSCSRVPPLDDALESIRIRP